MTLSALLGLRELEGEYPATGGFPQLGPVMLGFDVFAINLIKLLGK